MISVSMIVGLSLPIIGSCEICAFVKGSKCKNRYRERKQVELILEETQEKHKTARAEMSLGEQGRSHSKKSDKSAITEEDCSLSVGMTNDDFLMFWRYVVLCKYIAIFKVDCED
jgi:biotin synthase-like enzyme